MVEKGTYGCPEQVSTLGLDPVDIATIDMPKPAQLHIDVEGEDACVVMIQQHPGWQLKGQAVVHMLGRTLEKMELVAEIVE